MGCECAHKHDGWSSELRAKALTRTNQPHIMLGMARSKLKKGRGLSEAQAHRLRDFSKDTGKNQSELARDSRMSPSAFSRFLGGETHGSVDMVVALGASMGVNLWEHIEMDRMPDTPNFVSAVKQLGGAVTQEAVARVRVVVRLPDGVDDAPLDWWTQRLLMEEQAIQHHAKLTSLRVATATDKGRK